MREMYDAVTWQNIPASAAMVAGYDDGGFAWPLAAWTRFPHAVKVHITVFSANEAQVLDVENGDATPAQAPGWAQERRKAGQDPTVYCNASTWPDVRAAFGRQRVAEPHYWIADYDGRAEIPAGAVAKQYLGGPTAPVDVSAVADYWPGVDPAPKSEPHLQEDDVATGQITGTKQDIACPYGKQPASITFFCSMDAEIRVDCRDGKASVPVKLSYKAVERVPWPKENGIVVHVVKAPSDGTPITWAY
ncbi:MAG: hypothetical protein ACRDRL_00345 [Sciscionella sp.]